jgi:serine/threonine protein kinase
MIQTHPCPDASRWQALIADPDLPDCVELESHLAGCARCRAVLDEVAVGESGWLRDAGRLAGSTDNDPEMTKTLHRLRDYWPDDSHGPPIALDFLTKSDQPGLLGTLGRYQVLEVLGRGATGIVLKAIDPDLLRPVAIKVLAPYLAASGTGRQRFQREARAAAAVSHDHVVTIHAVESGDPPYLVMEFISGISLQARLDRDGPLPPKDIARIGNQAACGLAAAHAVGLVHRDVKPANILLENGVERVKITDFGLARAVDDVRLTQSGVAAGTPLYMSPEQARGETVDHRSDLFSLGAVLYTLATGFPPFRASSTMGVLNRIANDPPRPIRETVPDFPAALEAIIMQLLEKDPAKRFQLAADVSLRLSAFLADPQAEPPAADWPRRPRRRPTWWETSLPIFAGILVLGVVLIFRTPKGTLIVETDDPNIKVALDGEELKITGAGPQEVRLKPGSYSLTATKDGKPVQQEIVTITRDGKQVVKVTAKPDPDAPQEGKTEPSLSLRLLARIGTAIPDVPADVRALMVMAWLQAAPEFAGRVSAPRPGGPEGHEAWPKLQALLVEANQPEIDPERLRRVLTDARKLAEKINADWGIGPKPAIGANQTKLDPEWNSKLDALVNRFRDLTRRLNETSAGPAFLSPGPVADLDKAVAGMKEADRPRVKQLLALRDQFALGLPRLQARAVQLHDLRGREPGISFLETDVGGQHTTLVGVLDDMEKLAVALGAKPAANDPGRFAAGWEERFKGLSSEYQSLLDQLAKTPMGRVLEGTGPGAKKDLGALADLLAISLSREETERANRILVLRDQFAPLVSQFQKDLARWEQARLAAQTAGIRSEAGVISAADVDKSTLELKDAERVLATTEQTLAKLVTDLRTVANQVKSVKLVDSIETDYKKVMAEFDALVLRLVDTPIGRILALFPPDRSWNSAEVKNAMDGREEKSKPAVKLLEARSNILSQASRADTALTNVFNVRQQRARAQSENATADYLAVFDDNIAKSEHEVKLRTIALRGLVADLKKMADELDPPATPEAELKKAMADFDAVVLRLADTEVGRILALYPPDRGWGGDAVKRVFPGDPSKGDRAVWLLETRARIQTQADLAGKAIKDRVAQLAHQKEVERGDDAEAKAKAVEAVQRADGEARLRTTTLRGLVGELKQAADGLGAAKGK